jgi:hypothetical protein
MSSLHEDEMLSRTKNQEILASWHRDPSKHEQKHTHRTVTARHSSDILPSMSSIFVTIFRNQHHPTKNFSQQSATENHDTTEQAGTN